MRTYYVLWHYIANYSDIIPVEANNAEDAIERACGLYMGSSNTAYNSLPAAFRDKATVYVFDSPPALIVHKGERFTRGPCIRGSSSEREHVEAYLRATGR